MKQWKIEINAVDEAQAAKILKSMAESFEIADKYSMPLNFISMDAKGTTEFSTCNLIVK